MDQSSNTLQDLYYRLNDPNHNDIYMISQSILEYYNEFNIIYVLKDLVLNNNDEYIRKQAVIGIYKIFQNFKTDLNADELFFDIVIRFIFSDRSSFIKRYCIYIARMMASSENCDMYFRVVNENINDDTNIEYLSQILAVALEVSSESLDSNVEIAIHIIKKCFASQFIEGGITLLFQVCSCGNESIGPLFGDVIHILLGLIQSNNTNECETAITIMNNRISEDNYHYFIDLNLFNIIFGVINTNSNPYSIRELFLWFLINIIEAIPFGYADNDLVYQSFFTILSYLQLSYKKDEECDPSINNPMINIATIISHDCDLVSTILTQLLSEVDNNSKLFAVINAIFGFVESEAINIDQYIESIVSLIILSLQSDDICLKNCSSILIVLITEKYSTKLSSVIDYIISSYLVFISFSPYPSYLRAFSCTIMASHSSDNIFDECFNCLSNCFMNGSFDVQKEAFSGIVSLTLKSSISCLSHFEQLHEIFHKVYTNSDELYDFLHDDSLRGDSHLIKVSPELYKPYINCFFEVCLYNIESSRHESESMNSIYTLLLFYNSSFQTIICQLLYSIDHLCTVSKDSDDNGFFEEDMFENQSAISVSSSASRLFCECFKYQPAVLYDYGDRITEILNFNINGESGESTMSACKCIISLVDSMTLLPSSSQKNDMVSTILNSIISIIKNSADEYTIRFAIMALESVISTKNETIHSSLDHIYETLLMFFNAELFYQRGKLDITEEMVLPLYKVFNYLNELDSESFTVFCLKVFQFSSSNNPLQGVLLRIFAYICIYFSPPCSLIDTIYNLSINECPEFQLYSLYLQSYLCVKYGKSMNFNTNLTIVLSYISSIESQQPKSELISFVCTQILSLHSSYIETDQWDQIFPIIISVFPFQFHYENTYLHLLTLNNIFQHNPEYMAYTLSKLFVQSPYQLNKYLKPEELSQLKTLFNRYKNLTSNFEELANKICNNNDLLMFFLNNI